ncbi:MAG: Cd(II)/Pb(II)-responsive transcriptional regulator [Cyanobacteriota bacterium]|jgi:Cd(II)/Pb(II)-responsive transcriptional regulator
MRIGELARATGVSVDTLRYYEQEQLLTAPLRSRSNYRLYGNVHLEQVRFIRHCRSLDIGLDEIRELLSLQRQPQQSCLRVNALLDAKLAQVDQRIADLQQLQRELQDLRGNCAAPATAGDCGILHSLNAAAQAQR